MTHFRFIFFALGGWFGGLSAVLTSSTLTVWLKDTGLNYTEIGIFSLLHLPLALKFVWSPLLSKYRPPLVPPHISSHRGWMMWGQLLAIGGLALLALLSPTQHLLLYGWVVLVIILATTVQDITMLALQRHTVPDTMLGHSEAVGIMGFRLGMLMAGAGALALADYLSWNAVYGMMALVLFVTFLACIKAPVACHPPHPSIQRPILEALHSFKQQKKWLIILTLMVLYRVPDALMQGYGTLFYLFAGYSKTSVAFAGKMVGMGATIMGGFMGGYLVQRWGFLKTLRHVAWIHGLSFLALFLLLTDHPPLYYLYITSAAYHLTAGMAITGFFAYQIRVTEPKHALTQLAIITSLTQVAGLLLNPLGGLIIDYAGWSIFIAILCISWIPGYVVTLYLPLPQKFPQQTL